MSAINTTPLVDVMLVLLIIFLITSPGGDQDDPDQAAGGTQPGAQDQARKHHAGRSPRMARSIGTRVKSARSTVGKAQGSSQKVPQPEVHIRGDQERATSTSARSSDGAACRHCEGQLHYDPAGSELNGTSRNLLRGSISGLRCSPYHPYGYASRPDLESLATILAGEEKETG